MRDDRAPTPHGHHVRVQRTARYFTLGGPQDGSPPTTIWFALHGYAQLAEQFVRYFGHLASETDLVVAPEALNRFYLTGVDTAPASRRPVGATWMTREDRASEIADYVEYLDTLYDELARNAVSAGTMVNVIGFSQGAATATRWLTHGKSSTARLILWGGLMPPDTDLSRGAALLRGARLTFVLGQHDQYVDGDMLGAQRRRLAAAGIPHDVIAFDGGHVVSRKVFPRLFAPADA